MKKAKRKRELNPYSWEHRYVANALWAYPHDGETWLLIRLASPFKSQLQNPILDKPAKLVADARFMVDLKDLISAAEE